MRTLKSEMEWVKPLQSEVKRMMKKLPRRGGRVTDTLRELEKGTGHRVERLNDTLWGVVYDVPGSEKPHILICSSKSTAMVWLSNYHNYKKRRKNES